MCTRYQNWTLICLYIGFPCPLTKTSDRYLRMSRFNQEHDSGEVWFSVGDGRMPYCSSTKPLKDEGNSCSFSEQWLKICSLPVILTERPWREWGWGAIISCCCGYWFWHDIQWLRLQLHQGARMHSCNEVRAALQHLAEGHCIYNLQLLHLISAWVWSGWVCTQLTQSKPLFYRKFVFRVLSYLSCFDNKHKHALLCYCCLWNTAD